MSYTTSPDPETDPCPELLTLQVGMGEDKAFTHFRLFRHYAGSDDSDEFKRTMIHPAYWFYDGRMEELLPMIEILSDLLNGLKGLALQYRLRREELEGGQDMPPGVGHHGEESGGESHTPPDHIDGRNVPSRRYIADDGLRCPGALLRALELMQRRVELQPVWPADEEGIRKIYVRHARDHIAFTREHASLKMNGSILGWPLPRLAGALAYPPPGAPLGDYPLPPYPAGSFPEL